MTLLSHRGQQLQHRAAKLQAVKAEQALLVLDAFCAVSLSPDAHPSPSQDAKKAEEDDRLLARPSAALQQQIMGQSSGAKPAAGGSSS